MSSPRLEAALARLYADAAFRAAFLADAEAALAGAGLDPAERAALRTIDRADLALAAESYAAKRKWQNTLRFSALRAES